jgi:hypothetical protein
MTPLIQNRDVTAAVRHLLALKGFTHSRAIPPSRRSWFVDVLVNPETNEFAAIATRNIEGAFEMRVHNPAVLDQIHEDYKLQGSI